MARSQIESAVAQTKNLKMGTTCGRVIDGGPPAERELIAIRPVAVSDSETAGRSVRALDPPDPPVSPWRGEGASVGIRSHPLPFRRLGYILHDCLSS